MADEKVQINRPLVGILALACLFAAGTLAVQIYYLKSIDGETWNMWLAGFTRVGVLMTVFWIALPGRNRDAAWANVSKPTFFGILAAIIAAGIRPKIVIPLLIVLAVVGLIVKPRLKKRPENRTPR